MTTPDIPRFLDRRARPEATGWADRIIDSDVVLEPGLYRMSASVYHADRATLAPTLSRDIAWQLISRSPAHALARHPRLSPRFEPEASRRLDIGSLAHALLLGGPSLKLRLICADDYKGKRAQTARDSAYAEGKLPVLEADYETAVRMVDEAFRFIARCPDLRAAADGFSELSVFWREGETWCKGRPDYVSPDLWVVVNYKSTSNAHPHDAERRIFDGGYQIQGPWHVRGLDAIDLDGRGRRRYFFLFQEIEPPFACSLLELAGDSWSLGERQAEAAIGLWTECVARDSWPAYGPEPHRVECPPWVYNRWLGREIEEDERRQDAHRVSPPDGLAMAG